MNATQQAAPQSDTQRIEDALSDFERSKEERGNAYLHFAKTFVAPRLADRAMHRRELAWCWRSADRQHARAAEAFFGPLTLEDIS